MRLLCLKIKQLKLRSTCNIMRDHIQNITVSMKKLICIFFIVIQFSSLELMAHHSFTAEFTAERVIEIRGQIEEVWFKNPHVRYLLQVKDKKNNIEIWDLRGSPVVWLARKGWTKDRIKKGDEITVSGYPGHDGKKMLSIIEVKLSDGTILIDKAPK